jgi:putative membrane protein
VFGLGCITGILSFARVVSWLLKRYHNSTIALLAGFMIGSLNKIWPWKAVVTYRENSAGELVPFLEENLLPTEYLARTGQNPEFLLALLFMAFGVLLVVAIEKFAAMQELKSRSR